MFNNPDPARAVTLYMRSYHSYRAQRKTKREAVAHALNFCQKIVHPDDFAYIQTIEMEMMP